ncbi:MAG: hypothetical protein OEZ03_16280 [Alphaproteobacteria bacterium]|nr:hypothetical protein [Alphaproteobacteria bacterium]
MSYLNGPRINFWGGFQTNVCTTNNSEYDERIDVVHTTVTDKMTDAQIVDYFRMPATRKGANYYTNGGWNYYGDHGVQFIEAKVSSSGRPGQITEDGALMGMPVYLLGSLDPISGQGPHGSAVMVDIDPTSSQSTQIFVGGLQIGPVDKPALLIHGDSVCHSRFLGLRLEAPETVDAPGSCKANGTFQVTFPIEAVKSHDASIPILKDLMGTPGIKGIVMRFSVFECMPYMTTRELQADYAAHHNSSNPSSGHVIGSIGPAFEGEPDTVPPGRLLQNSSLPGPASGLALLNEEKGLLTLDVVSLVQKAALRADRRGFTDTIGPNLDFGDLTVSAGGKAIATFDPLPTRYFVHGGVFDIPVAGDEIKTLKANPISLAGVGPGGTLAVDEAPLRIYGDARNIYWNQDGDPLGMEITMHIRYLGGPLLDDTVVTLSGDKTGVLENPGFLSFPPNVHVSRGAQTFAFTVSGNSAGGPGFEAITLSGGSGTFINFRKYPTGDLPELPAEGLTWDYVYENVLRYFYVVFPAMSMRIPLNDENTVKATGDVILQRVSRQYRATTLCMPLTRAMSPERADILEKFFNQ